MDSPSVFRGIVLNRYKLIKEKEQTRMTKRKIFEKFKICVEGSSNWYPMRVPGSAMDTFYQEGILPDPYQGTNEYQWKEFFNNDFLVKGVFDVGPEEFSKEKLMLVFHGIDTIGQIFLNGTELGLVQNMHRRYAFSVQGIVQAGENVLEIKLTSPLKYIEKKKTEAKRKIHLTNTGNLSGSQYIRKAHCMFGWDWGPVLPDAGIFRPIELWAYSEAGLGETLVRQRHTKGEVVLQIETTVCGNNAETESKVSYELFSPDGAMIYEGTQECITIDHPQLWWPNGYGKQPLYTLKVYLRTSQERLDEKEYRIGLRTLTISQAPDKWGQEFAITVNGVKIFARGADYIPDDCFYARITKEVLERDVQAAVFANFNCLRVWGGGYYPSDTFYDLCDEYGILLWQDLMFACNIYDLTEDFIENIEEEAKDNLLRFRNHASLALICGNNEMETAWENWSDAKGHDPSLKRDYLLQFEYILQKIAKETAPDTFYWPSSPSSGGSFDNPDDENRGDCHYWDVWHGQKPFEEYLNHFFRFCSEFGFQSLPSMKTITAFAEKKDCNLFSRVMESHQKNPSANGKILYYLSETFRYPKNLESLVFLSQVLQGYAMKTATEHFRRNRGRCMGSIYWQFNDNWPVASWSSMDYFGRYKALHYMARKFCAPIAGSIRKQQQKVEFWISNETFEPVQVQAEICLKTLDFEILEEHVLSCDVPALSAVCMDTRDYQELIHGQADNVFVCVEYEYTSGGITEKKKEFEIFVPMKYLELKDPCLTVKEYEDGSVLLAAKSFVPYCMIESEDGDVIWEDNAVALTDETPVLLNVWLNQTDRKHGIKVYDVYHTYH